MSSPSGANTPRTRRVRTLAVLAGGLALGVAAAWTVAAWQDPEAASSTFTAGTFETQSQGAGGSWAHHESGSPASLAADLTGLAPGGTAEEPAAGESHYGWLNVRTAPGSTRGGEVSLAELTAGGQLATALEYRVVVREASTAECSAADFAEGATYLAGGPAGYLPVTAGAPSGPTVTVGPDGTDPMGLCLDLRVAAPSEGDTGAGIQGGSADVVLTVTVTQH